ncbi:unnamed protein product [Arabidopsis halleri]
MRMRSAGFVISRAAAHHRRWEIKQIGDPYLPNRRVIDEGSSRLFLMVKSLTLDSRPLAVALLSPPLPLPLLPLAPICETLTTIASTNGTRRSLLT